jgi:UDP-3-O-[3-hydroxymyristoyl] glucosamine N-acyltransferase
VLIGANTVLGEDCQVGEDTRIMPGVVLYPGVRIGARCLVHSGGVIGADGFGISRESSGAWVKVPQLGSVVIGNDVEIGANTTIDRGAIDDTVIGDGVKLDNQIQIGHNVVIGDHTAIAAMTGISGSTRIGARCMIGGSVGFAGHITVADDVVITARANVTNSIARPGLYSGAVPADEARRFRKNAVRFGQLDEIARRLRELERRVAARFGRD